jgi:hypothetical protein
MQSLLVIINRPDISKYLLTFVLPELCVFASSRHLEVAWLTRTRHFNSPMAHRHLINYAGYGPSVIGKLTQLLILSTSGLPIPLYIHMYRYH